MSKSSTLILKLASLSTKIQLKKNYCNETILIPMNRCALFIIQKWKKPNLYNKTIIRLYDMKILQSKEIGKQPPWRATF